MPLTDTDDARLVHAAQQGDTDSLTAIFRTHYRGMRSVANQILGPGPDAEDACQDAAMAALGRIRGLRDPSAVRAWLHTIVRNNCRMRLRAQRTVVMEIKADLPAPEVDGPERVVDRDADRDWVRFALGRLSPAVRPVAVLRYFSDRHSYEQIATLCGIPVGTVRSRLSEARRQLAIILPGVHDERHGDAAALTAQRRAEAAAILAGTAPGASERWAPNLVVHWPAGHRTSGPAALRAAVEQDWRLVDVVAGPDVTVWETVSATWLLIETNGQVHEVRVVHR
ncbi:RNA polymerase sigma-70 factor (ECF subfamily) [Actinoplanes lutulentus]|uniref:RNA polymerase sigma-70 factor (ECF subfamily) n=1 Tax=Actinoplanes lutulentus TaxID=1287878 RepID=A0A327YY57_9ACTN|nr:sigma-70 family RNA polymerase sigma factor [Actinoplanes lutulentus]MBB2946599.1 RNA polymerase sigma-70 factor (ECF subfamily) [Actinoplanes lutulentus]RAK26517.1 RNA polymerase sigma-70 factor (ECF subfamily) [Actinoplanes lutulentus]